MDALTTAARRISLDNLGQRLPVRRTGDELERLGDTWNEMLERLDNAVQRMRQFTADASHELRTPISIIRTASELALRRERTPEEYRKALESIHQESQWMTQLAEDLLLLARADAGSTQPEVRSPRCRRAGPRRGPGDRTHRAEVRGISLHTRLEAGEARAQGDEHVLHRILTILLRQRRPAHAGRRVYRHPNVVRRRAARY